MTIRSTFFAMALALMPMAISRAAAPATHASESEIADANRKIIASGEIASPGRVVVVYFTPKDREPAKDHTSRIRRITEETARFYASELDRQGFHDRTMNVFRNDDGEVDVIDVVGIDTDYDKPDGARICNEVIPVLRSRNIDVDRSVILLFCNLMEYDPVAGTISHHSPYYGGGSHLSGTAWQCDSEILDPLRFTDATRLKDAEYGRITVGRHNSIFMAHPQNLWVRMTLQLSQEWSKT